MDLTPVQTEILTALVSLFRQKECAVKGEEIARTIDRNPGTVRNQMQALRAMGMIEGAPGPKGGYRPTIQTYDVLDIIDLPGETITNIYRNGKLVEGATVCEISFTTVQHPNSCRGRVRIMGNVREFNTGDTIKIGPTPMNKLVIRGEVIGRDDIRNVLVYTISDMGTLPKRRIRECVRNGRVSIDADTTIKDAANILIKHGVHGAPVIDEKKVIGVVTLTRIVRALISGLINQNVWDVMSWDFISIDGDTPISSVAKLFYQHHVSNIVVDVNGKPYGIVSRDSILRESTGVSESIIAPMSMSA